MKKLLRAFHFVNTFDPSHPMGHLTESARQARWDRFARSIKAIQWVPFVSNEAALMATVPEPSVVETKPKRRRAVRAATVTG